MLQDNERWIPGYVNRYSVTDDGIVYDYRKPTRRRKGIYIDPLRYQRVRLDGQRWTVHHLVLRAWVGERPDGMVICHADDNPSNNTLSNLRYDTHAGNMADRKKQSK